MLRQAKTEYGELRGVPCGDPRITAFKGIPYAKPPVGPLRWKVPQPPEPWEGIREASSFAPMPMHTQPGLDWSEFYTRELNPTAYEYTMSEDCLYLNIWTPARTEEERLPVFFYIHGGGYTEGYSYEMEFDGERLARQGVIMVTPGYRLGGLGFFAHPDLTEEDPDASQGNFGFLDQLAALQWVRRNIAAFGGDPDRITIAGQSAGAGSVTALICSPLTEGLIKGAVMMSGGGLSPCVSLEEAQEQGKKLLKTLNVSSVEEARMLPAGVISATFINMRNRGPRKPVFCVDGVFLNEPTYDTILGNRLSDIPLLFGFCHDEGYGFIQKARMPKSLEAYEEQVRRDFGRYADRYFELANVHSMKDLSALYNTEDFHWMMTNHICLGRVLSEQGRTAYIYEFDHDVPGEDHAGSFHGSDLWFVFNSLNRCWRPFTGKHYDLARQVSTYFMNFVKNGNPNGTDHDRTPLPEWRAFGEEAWLMRFESTPVLRKMDPPGELLKLRQDQALGRLDPCPERM